MLRMVGKGAAVVKQTGGNLGAKPCHYYPIVMSCYYLPLTATRAVTGKGNWKMGVVRGRVMPLTCPLATPTVGKPPPPVIAAAYRLEGSHRQGLSKRMVQIVYAKWYIRIIQIAGGWAMM